MEENNMHMVEGKLCLYDKPVKNEIQLLYSTGMI